MKISSIAGIVKLASRFDLLDGIVAAWIDCVRRPHLQGRRTPAGERVDGDDRGGSGDASTLDHRLTNAAACADGLGSSLEQLGNRMARTPA